jgi:hypothetical protein
LASASSIFGYELAARAALKCLGQALIPGRDRGRFRRETTVLKLFLSKCEAVSARSNSLRHPDIFLVSFACLENFPENRIPSLIGCCRFRCVSRATSDEIGRSNAQLIVNASGLAEACCCPDDYGGKANPPEAVHPQSEPNKKQ